MLIDSESLLKSSHCGFCVCHVVVQLVTRHDLSLIAADGRTSLVVNQCPAGVKPSLPSFSRPSQSLHIEISLVCPTFENVECLDLFQNRNFCV